jgi:hydroxypyruvate isomerase
MPQFAANLSWLFQELPFLERFAAARAAGFTAVEYMFPYAWDKHELAQLHKAHGLPLVLHNLPPGDYDAGERGMACHPGREAEFRASVALGIGYATALGCPQVHAMAGLLPAGVSRETAHRCLVANLQYAAAQCRQAGLRLLIEPINVYDIPGFFLNTAAQAAGILDDVGADNLFIQFDIYHAQRMHGELAATIQKYLPRIAHMQLADNPGRHEPGTGEINYGFLFRHLDAIGYTGWIGCEYKPLAGTVDGLGWLRALGSTPAATP